MPHSNDDILKRGWSRWLTLGLLAGSLSIFSFGLSGCERDDTAEEIGEEIDEAADDVEDAVDDAVDDMD